MDLLNMLTDLPVTYEEDKPKNIEQLVNNNENRIEESDNTENKPSSTKQYLHHSDVSTLNSNNNVNTDAGKNLANRCMSTEAEMPFNTN